MPEKFPILQNSSRGVSKQLSHLTTRKKLLLSRIIWKLVQAENFPRGIFELSVVIVHPTRWKWVETSKIAVFYNFYRFRGGLDPFSNPPQMQIRVCQTLYYPFLISTNQCPYDRNNFRCSSQLAGIPLRSLSKVQLYFGKYSVNLLLPPPLYLNFYREN